MKNVRDSRISWMRGFVDTFRLFTQGNGHYSWWSHFANSAGRGTSGGESTTFSWSRQLRDAVKGAEIIHPHRSMGSDHWPGQRHARCINPQGRALARASALAAVLFDLDGTLVG